MKNSKIRMYSRNILYRFPSDLCHDGALSSQVLIAQAQEVVNYKRYQKMTEEETYHNHKHV